jgi:methionyl-tRNA synthetase
MSKKFYLTTAIPYANAKPHIGTAMDYLYGDILLRYYQAKGDDALMSIGTDEHGTKVEQKAAENGQTPQEFVDSLQPDFQEMRAKLNLDFDHIVNVRTTDPDHVRRVQEIWRKLDAAGMIYKSTYEGWYCVGCEGFVTETEAKELNYVCPDHDKPFEKLSEDNYYLKVSQFTDQIREFASKNIVPAWRGKELLELVKDGAQDVSISRPVDKLTWGIPVPGDDSQVMYVWIDALSNYITALGFPDKKIHPLTSSSDLFRRSAPDSRNESENDEVATGDDRNMDFWPANVEIVGKDILRFHAIIWPAMLLALGLELPEKLLVHGFVNVGGAKMSKSVGNVVSPLEIIENYGTDAFRYYFARHIPTFDDGDFTWEKFEAAYNGELANDLGNLVSRTANMIKKYCAGQIPNGEHREKIEKVDTVFDVKMREFDISAALENFWKTIQDDNKFIEDRKPWALAKNISVEEINAFRDQIWPLADAKNYDSREELDAKNPARSLYIVLWTLAESLRDLAENLAPFLPETAAKIQEIFGGNKIPDEIPILFPKKYLHSEQPNQKGQ